LSLKRQWLEESYRKIRLFFLSLYGSNYGSPAQHFYFNSKIAAIRFGTELVLAPYEVSIKPRSIQMKENNNMSNQNQSSNQRRDSDQANKAGQNPNADKSSSTSQTSRDSQYGEKSSSSQTQKTNK